MPLRDLRLDDEDRLQMCERHIISLLSVTLKVGSFHQYEVAAHADAIEIARDRLSQILDKAEGK